MRIDDTKIRLTVVQRPGNFRAVSSAGVVGLLASPMQVTAQCQVTPDPSSQALLAYLHGGGGPRSAPWKLGFMQLQILENSWAYYRGAQGSQGCVLNDISSQRQTQICRDYDRSLGTIWYEGSANVADCYGLPDVSRPSPWSLEFYFGDNPHEDIPAQVVNDQTQIYNYLYEARCALAFVTTLSEQTAPNVFKHHRHFFWSAIWHLQAASLTTQPNNTMFRMLHGSGFWISDFKPGGPKDSRYLALLNNSSLTSSCNDVAQNAGVAKSTAPVWRRFPLMDQKDNLF